MQKIDRLDCILFIDDDDSANFFNKLLIDKINPGVRIQIARNGIEALEFLTHTGKFEGDKRPMSGIIFLDINMPAMNGWEFLEAYKSLPEAQKARIVIAILTTSLNPDDEERARTYNEYIKEFIIKPLTIKIFDQMIDKYFR